MEALSGRKIELQFKENVGISDLDYQGERGNPFWDQLRQHNESVWSSVNNSNWSYRRDKTLLLLNGSVPSRTPGELETLGEGINQGSAGWASLKTFCRRRPRTGAHVWGHPRERRSAVQRMVL